MIYIQVIGLAIDIESEADGQYIKDFIPDIDEFGHGRLVTTPNLQEAKRFAESDTALEFYRQQSKRCPFRDDGRPNRPLTAYTVSFGRD